MGAQGRSPARLRAAWLLAHHDVPRRAALVPTDRALRIRWADQLQCFRAYVEQLLVRCLGPGDIFIMDNLGSHKSAELRRIIRAAGARLCICRPTHPTSTEQAFAKIKHWMLAAQKRTGDELWQHIGGLVSTMQAHECSNYFANAGYGSIKP